MSKLDKSTIRVVIGVGCFVLGTFIAVAYAVDIVPPDNAVCWSTQPDEVLQTAVVALMDGGTQRRSTTLKPPFTVREFTHTFSKAGTVPLNITGIRLICEWTVPAPVKSREIRTTSQFAVPVVVAVGDSPKLRVRIDKAQGQWTVTILNAAQLTPQTK